MSFQQPVPMTVRQTHFRGKTYTFPVVSVLASESTQGLLHLEASEGYLLTTSANETPQASQTLPYVKQPDGSWLASGTVCLTATATALINGSVTLHDPLGETLSLPVRIAPSLFVDSTEISFEETKPGETTATILTIRQRGALTPVNLTIAPKHQFSLADAKTAMIPASTLTVTPAFEGNDVIIMYKPNRGGRNAARLVITTPYEIKIVQLSGHSGGLLGRFHWPEIPQLQWSAIPFRVPIIASLAAVVFGGMLWMAYTMLAQSKNRIDLTVLPQRPAETYVRLSTPVRKLEKPLDQAPRVKRADWGRTKYAPVELAESVGSPAPEPLSQSEETGIVKKESEPSELEKPTRPKPEKSGESVAAKSAPTFAVEKISELEKELNASAAPKQP